MAMKLGFGSVVLMLLVALAAVVVNGMASAGSVIAIAANGLVPVIGWIAVVALVGLFFKR